MDMDNPDYEKAMTEVTADGLLAISYGMHQRCNRGLEQDCEMKMLYLQIYETYKQQDYQFSDQQMQFFNRHGLRVLPSLDELEDYVDKGREIEANNP
jgi:hypothetical protein